ncbi:MAG: response regulator [Scytonema sp. PMC 1069.18]|nr:response regulator [Scytonema sp. PMC 1069.18]MEC4882523.1 response regulator [Scytonema sp. PMC 1070.18]
MTHDKNLDMVNDPRKLILVVEDNLTNVKVLFDFLESAGFRTLVAQSGESALEKLRFISPDLILLDVMMPGMNGFETCCRLKASEATKDIPIIFMTVLSDEADRVKGLTSGAVDYITKPFQQEEVLARIKIHLELSHLKKNLEQLVAERTAELTKALEQLQRSQRELQQSQVQLVQSEKMSALGQLVAGVAHEINNPVGFIAGNVKHAQNYIQDLLGLIELYQQKFPNPDAEIEAKMTSIDLNYLKEDLPKLLASMEEGAARIHDISTSLRTFSRADINDKVPFNVHEGIDSTILLLKHRLKANENRPEIQIVKDYGQLPEIECFPGQLNQVFMNLLANAIDSLEESNQGYTFAEIEANPNLIIIKTTSQGDRITICITDNGVGMSDEVKTRIFDHLFTTKPVGHGTGLGLSIVRQIILNNHGGTLQVHSAPKLGAEFIISIPIKNPTPFDSTTTPEE